MTVVTREEARNMVDAHADGLHAELPREFCPACDGRELSSYPTHAQVEAQRGAPILAETRKGREEALRLFEEACNYMALVFGGEQHDDVRAIVVKARGDVREALGEGRT
jgi:hypothetical protein